MIIDRKSHKRDLKFSITSYKGYEDEIVRMLNANRLEPHSCQYQNWRYLDEESPLPPVVFWLHSSKGDKIGMAALIFRTYWIGNKPFKFAVLGDISLNDKYRGKGVAKQLFKFMNSTIDKESYSCAFVMPNTAAQKSLSGSGWKTEQYLVPFVYLLDVSDWIYDILKINTLANLFGKLFRYFNGLKLAFKNTDGFSAEAVNDFDKSFDTFWVAFDKKNMIIGDKSISTLDWRYKKHPAQKFSIYKLMYNDRFIGFIVYSESGDKVCSIYEFIVLNQKYIEPSMTAFIKKMNKTNSPKSIRITLNERHPYAKALRSAGFIKRKTEGVFQTYMPSGSDMQESFSWFIGSGDKDT
ncbi:MAG: hypothetical protein AVO38_15810 [delta proteobacterium ML8_D]|nr:MAG: hypothetical protein AVO38_15810 [delta proteobacterium ML8_D]